MTNEKTVLMHGADFMSRDLCEQKHGEIMRGMAHIEDKVDSLTDAVLGNGKPGLRETQLVVAAIQTRLDKQDSALWRFISPALPILYGLIFGGIVYAVKTGGL